MALRIIACVLIGYLLGGLNGAIVISHAVKLGDVREHGSGNAGLTNFLRSYGGWRTLLVVALDLGKVFLACWLATLLLPEQTALAKMAAGAAAQVGHVFPAYYGFHGGKGILCSGALALVMDWRVFVIVFALFLLLFLLTKLVSLGSVCAAVVYPVAFWLFFRDEPAIWAIALGMALLAIIMHRGNIVRLFKGTERKTELFKSNQK